jgi:hypothetical protein
MSITVDVTGSLLTLLRKHLDQIRGKHYSAELHQTFQSGVSGNTSARNYVNL